MTKKNHTNEHLCVFELFSIGIGPSSSHSVAPMKAGYDFYKTLKNSKNITKCVFEKNENNKGIKIKIELYYSLASTGLGHGTKESITMGLLGYLPNNADIKLYQNMNICDYNISFTLFPEKILKPHPNKITISCINEDKTILSKTYYSIGAGVILNSEFEPIDVYGIKHSDFSITYNSMKDLISICETKNKQIWEVVLDSELQNHSMDFIQQSIKNITNSMSESIKNGLTQDEPLVAGKLIVPLRAKNCYEKIKDTKNERMLVSSYALAVSEQNASRSRLVTAPTNGSAGVIPSVLMNFAIQNGKKDLSELDENTLMVFLFCAFSIGNIIKQNASLAGSILGCQAEIGSACSMASAGLTAICGGNNAQVENAAEIGLEHFLGLTCDPIDGYVIIPCIERNAIAANTAITASSLALIGNGGHKVSLDQAVLAMNLTGEDMDDKYRETSKGGLAKTYKEL